MDEGEQRFNLEVRKFLKKVGITSQHEIEQAVAQALKDRKLTGTETLKPRMVLEVKELNLRVQIDGDIRLN